MKEKAKLSDLAEFKNVIDETKLNEECIMDNRLKALSPILNYLRGELGDLYQLPGFETVRKPSGKVIIGIHYLDNDGDSLRFNWDNKSNSTEIHSIDFFNAEEMFYNPVVTLYLNGESVDKILPAVATIHKTKDPNMDIESLLESKTRLDEKTLDEIARGEIDDSVPSKEEEKEMTSK